MKGKKINKRERLLGWIRNGDPADVPVLMGPGFELAASYLGKDQTELTWADAIKASQETDTHNIGILGSPSPFHAVPFLDDISMNNEWSDLPDGGKRLTQNIETSEGNLRSIQEFPKDKGAYHVEFYVKGNDDFPAFASFIRKTTEAVVSNPIIRQNVSEQINKAKEEINNFFPTAVHLFCPAVELMSSIYMDQEKAVFSVYDHKKLMEELMETHWKMTQVWLEVVAENDIDIYNYTINGLEWLSPDLYDRYMIPQAKRINEFATSQGKLSWLHTCGKKKKLAKDGVYQKMKVDIVESLSSLPTGDIDDLAQTRRDIGSDIVTRGGINVEYMYSQDLEVLKKQAEYVVDSTAGFKHMVGDTNASYPAYPWENIKAVIDVIRRRGKLFE